MSEVRSSITYAGKLIRANVFTQHGASTHTCRTLDEAKTFIVVASVRKPVGKERWS